MEKLSFSYVLFPFFYIKGKYFAVNRFNCKNEITPLELAELMENKLGIKHIRICGARDVKCTKISACFGTPGGVFEELKDSDVEIVLTGEACEWSLAEYARDAAALGYKKALLIMGHIGSERDGMKYLTKLLKDSKCHINEWYNKDNIDIISIIDSVEYGVMKEVFK